MKNYMLTALIAMAALASCKKEAPQQNNTHAQVVAMAKDGDDDCANPQNPYDYAGYQHNQLLQATHSVWSADNATIDDIHNAVNTYSLNHSQSGLTAEDIELANAVNADIPNNFTNVVSTSSLSSHGKTVATQLVSVMTNISATATYPDYKASIVAFESTVLTDDNLTDADKESLLKSTSVARYSMCYWLNQVNDGNPEGSNPVQCRNIFQRIADWWNAAVDRFDTADAITAIKGGDNDAVGNASIHAFFHP